MPSNKSREMPQKYLVFAFAIFALLVFWSRLLPIDRMSFDLDEVRSAMRAAGTIPQIIAWQPEDWPPLYNVMLGVWRSATSAHPITLRYSSILLFLPGLALMFQFTRRITHSQRAAWGVMIVYAALGYASFLSLYLRAYALALTLLPLLLILTDRYFKQPRRWWWGISLGVTIAALFYTTYTSVLAFMLVGLYTLLCFPRRMLYWVPPVALSFVLVLPELVRKASIFTDRLSSSVTTVTTTFELQNVYSHVANELVGQAGWLWAGLALIAVIAFGLRSSRLREWNILLWLVTWTVIAPLLLFVMLDQQIYYFLSTRYIWWLITGAALLLGIGLARLPQLLYLAAIGVTIALMFTSFTLEGTPDKREHYEDSFVWLADNIQAGDVLVVDPNLCYVGCFSHDRWVYYRQTFLDDHLEVVDHITDERRVWYLHMTTDYTQTVADSVTDGRIDGRFVGPTNFFAQLWQAPPDPEGVLFGDTLRFHGIEWLDEARHPLPDDYLLLEQTTARVRLWWSIDQVPGQPYSVSLQLLNQTEQLVTQSDQTPQVMHLNPANYEPLPIDMTQWEVGQLYVEEREIDIPELEDKVWADAYLVVYQWWDDIRLSPQVGEDEQRLSLGIVPLLGW